MRAVVLAALLAGCATAPTPPVIERLPEGAAGTIAPARYNPLTLDEVVELSRMGTPPNTLIQMLRDSRTAYALTAGEGEKLAARGVPDEVIAYMRGSERQAPQPYGYYPYSSYASPYPYYGNPYPYRAYPYRAYPYWSAYPYLAVPLYPWSGVHFGVGINFGIGRRW